MQRVRGRAAPSAIRHLIRTAPAPRAYDHAAPLPPQEPDDPPPAHWQEGDHQCDWAGPEMERRNVARLGESLAFQAREARIARVLGYDRPEYFEGLRRAAIEAASRTAEEIRDRERARRERAKRFRSYGK